MRHLADQKKFVTLALCAVCWACAHGDTSREEGPNVVPSLQQAELQTCESVRLHLEDDSVVAEVNGKPVTGGEINAEITDRANQSWRTYCTEVQTLREEALDHRIRLMLVKEAADREELSLEEWLDRRQAAAGKPTAKEIEQFYAQEIPNGEPPLEKIRGEIELYLIQKKAQSHLQDVLGELYAGAEVKMNLPSVGPPSIQFTNPPNAPMLGLPEALTTVTVFSDFECPYCSKMAQELNDLITGAPKLVKVVFRHFPLSFHPNATNAAVFAGCAHQQNKFRVFHDSLFESGQDLTRKGLWLLAEKHGLDRTQMETCVNGQEIYGVVEHDMNEGKRIGVKGTPTLFIGQDEYRGERTAEALRLHLNELVKSDL